MSGRLSEEQESLRDLAARILDDRCPLGRPPAAYDRDLWAALADSGVVGAALALPAGAGQGLVGLAAVLEELGRRAALLPLAPSVVAGLVLEEAAPGLAAGFADRLARGELIATLALEEPAGFDPHRPALCARAEPGGWRLEGTKIAVPYAEQAGIFLVSASAAGTPVLAVVEAAAPGLSVAPAVSTDGEPSGALELDGVAVPAAWTLAAPAARRAVECYTAALCATASGVLAGGLAITAGYIAGREQFGRPIASFQGPALRLADAYIDSQAVQAAAWSALRLLAAGEDAAEEVTIAKFWVAEGGQRAVHAFQHLHGGMGVDTSYPIHRYFEQAKALEVRLGGASVALERLGEAIARRPHRSPKLPLSDDQRKLRDELRSYFAELMAAEAPAGADTAVGSPAYRRIIRRLGSDGWLGVGWPEAYGGQGRGPLEQLIFFEEANRAEVPLPLVTLNTVGPTLAEYGTEEQKARFLPGILAGEIHFAIGYTEPGAGTDLAALQTRAELDGDHYVVHGQKVFTTGAHDADFVWLACRTDPDAPRHRGISILIVDTRDPGFSWTPIHTVGGGSHTNATFYDGVRVPISMRVGPENGGWRLITTQLNFERVALGPAGKIWKAYEPVVAWATETGRAGGGRVVDLPWVRHNLARVRAKTEVAELWNWRIAAGQESGSPSPADASALKVYGTELVIEALRLLMEVVGPHAAVAGGAGSVLGGALDHQYKAALVGTFGGGVNEVQREIVASAGLGLPRVPR
jgi:alkylation response protein AidB-like acyl-CoA dehydrogenase